MSDPVSEIKARVEQAEALTGARARVARLEYNLLRERGVLLKVHVTGSSMFQVAAKHGEYGIGDELKGKARSNGTGKAKRKLALEPGKRNLIPGGLINAWHSGEARARYCPKKFGIKDFLSDEVSDFHFITFGQWPLFDEKWQEIVAVGRAWVEDVCARHAELREWCVATTEASASEAWDAIATRRVVSAKAPVMIDGKAFTAKAGYVQWLVADTLAQFPTVEKIREECRIGYRLSVLATTADLDAERAVQDKAQADQAEARTRLKESETEAWQISETAKADVEAMRAAKQARALEELEAARPMARFIEALNDKMLGYVLKFKEAIGDGHVPGKTAEFGRNLINVYTRYNAGIVDAKTEALLKELGEKIGNSAKTRKIEEIDAAVAALEEELQRNVADILDQEPNRFRYLDLE